MRVVVVHPARTEEDGTEVPASVAAYRQGRIDDFVNPLTGETTPKQAVVEYLLAEAQAEHPDLQVAVQYLHDNGDGTSTWKNEPPEQPVPPGAMQAHELSVEQGQEASS